MSKEYVILKGTDTFYSGYPTNATLEADSSYIEFTSSDLTKCLTLDLERGLSLEGDNQTFSSGFKTNNNKVRRQFSIRSYPITYPASAISFEDFINDGTNNINDVLAKKYLYIQNDDTANAGDTRLWLVPTSEINYTTKNLNVVCTGLQLVQEEGGGGVFYHVVINLEYATR